MSVAARQRGQTQPGAVGKLAEAAVLAYLTRLGKTVQDVRQVRTWQVRDVDFIATTGTLDEYIEVKCDTWLHKSGNLFFEVQRDHLGAGCFLRSKADWWYYVDGETGDALILPLSEVQRWVFMNSTRIKGTTTRSHRRGQFVQYFGYLCPAELLVQELGVQRITLPLK